MKKYIVLVLILALTVSFLLGIYLNKLKQINEQIAFETEFDRNENIINEAKDLLTETISSEFMA